MLYLYGKHATDFTTNGDPIRHSYDEHVVRDEGFYLSFKLLLDKEEQYKTIHKEMIISALTPEGRNQFRVYDTWKRDTYLEIMAVQLLYDFNNKQVNPFNLKKANGKQVIQSFQNSFKSSLGTFTLDSPVTEQHDFSTNEEDDNTLNHNALEILNRITKRWDSELMLNGFDIRMIKRLGEKTDALLYEKKNISEFEDESTMRGMATRIHATSTFRAEGSEEDTTISVTVDSPLLDEYAQVYEKSYMNNNCHTESELIDWVKLKYSSQNIDKPKRTIRVSTNIIDGTEINYGDDLVLKYLVHDVDEIIRCVGYDYNPIRATYYSVTLGDWKDSFLNTITGSIIDTTDKELEQIKNNIAYVGMAANGKNRNAWGPYPVPNPINGDQWFYFEWERPNEIELRIYQDGEWIPIRFASKQEVEQAQATADQAKQDAIKAHDDAVLEADRLVKEQSTKFEADLIAQKTQIETDITTSRDEAVATAQAGITALETAHSGRMDIIKSEANEIKATADSTRAEVDLAVANAGFTNLNDTVFALGTLAAGARDEALKKADKTYVDGQLATKVAQATYNEKVAEINTAVNSNRLGVERTETELLSKATKTEVNSLSTKLTTAETGITQNATQIALRAKKSDLDTVKGRLTSAESSIVTNANQIKLKVAQTDFNNLSGKVTTAETNINLNKDAILLRATKSSVDGLTGRVTANESAITVANNQIALRATKTEVSTAVKDGFDGIEIGGTNLLTDGLYGSGVVVRKQPDGSYIITNSNKSEWGRATSNTVVLEPNQTYTVSMDVLFRTGSYAGIGFREGNADYGNHTLQVAKGKVSSTYTNTTNAPKSIQVWVKLYYSGTSYNKPTDIASIHISGLQVEKGNKATDWSPAPEDVANSITSVSSALTVETGKIQALTTSVTSQGTQINSVTQTADANKASITSTNGKISTIEQAIGGIQSTVANKAEKSEVTQLAGSITSTVNSAIDSVEIGGRNLYQDGAKERSSTRFISYETWKYLEEYIGRTATVSFDIKLDTGGISREMSVYMYQSSGISINRSSSVTPTPSWKRHSYQGSIISNNIPSGYSKGAIAIYDPVGNNNYLVKNFKIELGNKATDWSPAPEDMATASQIIQLSDSINLKVSKGDVSSQINIEAGRTLISTGKLILDANTYIMGTTFANDIKAKSLEAVNADIANISTKILTADVITSTHLKVDSAMVTKMMVSNLLVNKLVADTILINSITSRTLTTITANIVSIRSQILVTDSVTAVHVKSDNAMIDNLFATDALVNRLTAKTAFITSVKAIDISADRLTAGTINAANVNIINLNVSKLVGNVTNFVTSAWNAANSTVTLDGRGIVTANTAGRYVEYANGGIAFGGGGERVVLRNNTGSNANRTGISLEPNNVANKDVDFDISTRGKASLHMGISDLDLGYRLQLSNDDINTNNYYFSLKTGTRFDIRLNSTNAAGTNKNRIEFENYDGSGNVRIGKNAGYGASMYLVGDDVIFAKGGTSNRSNVFAGSYYANGYNYIESGSSYSIEKTISKILAWIGPSVAWQKS